eukprot:UN33260
MAFHRGFLTALQFNTGFRKDENTIYTSLTSSGAFGTMTLIYILFCEIDTVTFYFLTADLAIEIIMIIINLFQLRDSQDSNMLEIISQVKYWHNPPTLFTMTKTTTQYIFVIFYNVVCVFLMLDVIKSYDNMTFH